MKPGRSAHLDMRNTILGLVFVVGATGLAFVFLQVSSDRDELTDVINDAPFRPSNVQASSPELTQESASSAKPQPSIGSEPQLRELDGESERPAPPPTTDDSDSEMRDLASYLGFDQYMALEPVDPNWAPAIEATLDSTVRTMDAPIRDVVVRCGSPQVQVSRQAPEGSELESPAGTIFEDSGITAGVFTLTKGPRDTD